MKITETESRQGSPGLRGGSLGSDCFMGTEFQLGKMKIVLERVVAMAAQQCECTQCYRTVHSVYTELNILKWLRWNILCYVYFTKIKLFFFFSSKRSLKGPALSFCVWLCKLLVCKRPSFQTGHELPKGRAGLLSASVPTSLTHPPSTLIKQGTHQRAQ